MVVNQQVIVHGDGKTQMSGRETRRKIPWTVTRNSPGSPLTFPCFHVQWRIEFFILKGPLLLLAWGVPDNVVNRACVIGDISR